jgi:multidrug efflux pump subunit AcrB
MTTRRFTAIAAGVLFLGGAAVAAYFLFRSTDDRKKTDPSTTRAAPYQLPQVISVTASYPGADALTVADTVAAPIEEQVNGVENMLSMTSACANDGSYTLQITFKEGTNLDIAQVLVQNRVSLAMPVVPQLVQNEGISVSKKSPQPLVLVSLTSPDGRFDPRYLSKYAVLQFKDELARLSGVADVVLFGQHDYGMSVTLDADKLAARKLTETDVIAALREQNLQVVAGRIGQPPLPKGQQFQLTISTLGRLQEPDEFGNIIIKGGQVEAPATAPDAAQIVRLRDVARVERGGKEGGHATLDGKPAVLLGIYPLPSARASQVSRAVVEKLAELRPDAPEGLACAVAFDLAANLEEPDKPATPEHLVIDVHLPDSASKERTVEALKRAAKVVRETPGIEHVLALTEHPFSLVRNRPCLIVGLAPNDRREAPREQVAERLRASLRGELQGAAFWLSLPSTAAGYPVYGWPIDFTIEDRGHRGWSQQQQRADTLIEKMIQSGKFSDVGADPGLRGTAVLNLNIDREKCQALGIPVSDVLNTMQAFLGPFSVNNSNQPGRIWQVTVKVDQPFRDRTADIVKLEVRNKEGDRVPLGTVLEVRDQIVPAVIQRHNMYPMARITANLAEGVSMAEARTLCETMTDQEFGTRGVKLSWRP